ncbi:MAG: hypothetical protein HY321_10845 [Armatimonadetes bacterium]|nr:hypothetical protein [Armatimonadota bacterium]
MEAVLDVRVRVPEDTSEEVLRQAQERVRESAVVFLQQECVLTIREAARDLGLTYEGYLELLAEKGLPATSGVTQPEVLDGHPPFHPETAMRFLNTAGPVDCARHYCIPPLERLDLDEVLMLVAQRPHRAGKRMGSSPSSAVYRAV